MAAARGKLEAAHIGDGDEWGSREEEARRRRHSIGVHRLEIGDLPSGRYSASCRMLLAQLIGTI